MPSPLVDACGSALGLTFYTLDRAHRRVARAQRRGGVSHPTGAERSAIVRGAFQHFGRLLFELLKFSTLSPTAMLARVEFDGEERVRARLRAGQGRAVRHRALRLLGAAGAWCTRCSSQPMAVMARALDNPQLQRPARERSAQRTGNTRDLPAGHASAACMRDAAGRPRRRHADRSAHPEPRRRSTSISSTGPAATTSARRGAGAANRRAGRAGVRAAARPAAATG